VITKPENGHDEALDITELLTRHSCREHFPLRQCDTQLEERGSCSNVGSEVQLVAVLTQAEIEPLHNRIRM
jgi:hypothetical protein